MAEPWSDDLAALGEESHRGLRSFAATRASVPPENKMRFYKAHPALAALLVLVFLAVTGPLAYAFVHHVLVTVDPDKPTDQIEHDVSDQLHAAGVEANVKATKPDDGTLQIRIQSSDESLGSNLAVKVSGDTVPAQVARGIRIECHECSEDRQQAAARAATVDSVLDVVDDDAAIGPALEHALAAKGFAHVTVTVAADAVTVRIEND